jgi:hypothetical protein
MNELPDDGSPQWSTRTMAERMGTSKDTVARIWKDHGLKPWKLDTFKISTDPGFEAKLVDVVGLYMNPRARRRLQLLQEDPGSGPRSHPAVAQARTREDDDARPQAPRHDGPVRRDERCARRGPL